MMNARIGDEETVILGQRDVVHSVFPVTGGTAIQEKGVTPPGKQRYKLVHNSAPGTHVPLSLGAELGQHRALRMPAVELGQR